MNIFGKFLSILFPDPAYDSLYGYCKQCKNPMYIPSKWYGSIPPPVMKTCYGTQSYEGHNGLPTLAGDEFGFPLRHPVNRGRFTQKQEQEIIKRYSSNYSPRKVQRTKSKRI